MKMIGTDLKNFSIGVAMCTYNGETHLREQIDSILRQSTPVDEIVVADDNSQDGTRAILQEYAQKLPDLFRLHFHPSGLGAVSNFEFALTQSTTDLVFLCDQDDRWRPDKVDVMSKPFFDTACLMVFTDGTLVDESGSPLHSTLWKKWGFSWFRRLTWKRLPHAAVRDLLLNNNKVTGATVAMRNSLVRTALPIAAPNGYWHDAWFALHAAAGRGLIFIPDRLIDYRVHARQQVGLVKGGDTRPVRMVSWGEFADSFVYQYPQFRGLVSRMKLKASLKNWAKRFSF